MTCVSPKPKVLGGKGSLAKEGCMTKEHAMSDHNQQAAAHQPRLNINDDGGGGSLIEGSDGDRLEENGGESGGVSSSFDSDSDEQGVRASPPAAEPTHEWHELTYAFQELHIGEIGHQGWSWREFRTFLGPAWLVSIAYLDPGNLETDLQSGAQVHCLALSPIQAPLRHRRLWPRSPCSCSC